MSPALHFASVSDVGRQRQRNEDSHGELALGDDSVLLVVCDGMGGHEAGDVASALAVKELLASFARPVSDPRAALYEGFIQANAEIAAQAGSIGRHGMGTTGVAAFVQSGQAWVAHVGDSRLYLLREGKPVFRTKDHTRVQRMVDLGILSEAQAKVHPEANVITRALGHPTTPDGTPLEPDVRSRPLELKEGDALLICSDGLYDLVEDEEFWGQIAGRTPVEAAQRLVDLANARGGDDNITVTLLSFGRERFAGEVDEVPASEVPPAPVIEPLKPASRSKSPLLLVALGVAILAGALWLALRPDVASPLVSNPVPDAGEIAP